MAGAETFIEGANAALARELELYAKQTYGLRSKRGRVRLNFQQQRSGLAARSHMDSVKGARVDLISQPP